MADTKDSVTPYAVTFKPTPTQAENDAAVTTGLPAVKAYDGSPIDQSSKNPAVPAPPGSPSISSLTPITGALPSAPFAVGVHGAGFTAAAKVFCNQNQIAAVFSSATLVNCTITAAAVGSAPGTYPVLVEDVGGFSNTVTFAVTATMVLAAEEESKPHRSRRSAASETQTE